MKKEIKFRAWDSKRMREIYKIMYTDDGMNIFFTDTHPPDEPGHLNFSDNRLSLLQFTRLKDIENKEIFEGDILFVQGDVKINGQINPKVKMPKGKYFEVYFKSGQYTLSRAKRKRKYVLTGLTVYQNSLIRVGNIYENPELL